MTDCGYSTEMEPDQTRCNSGGGDLIMKPHQTTIDYLHPVLNWLTLRHFMETGEIQW